MINTSYKKCYELANKCAIESISVLMGNLTQEMTVADSKIIDHALSLVDGEDGFKIMEHFLFNGTRIQSNYCSLYFARRGEYQLVTEAYPKGCIDGTQFKAMGCY